MIVYHWHPSGRSSITGPHLHVHANVHIGDRWLGKVHLPTGVIRLSDVVAFAIEDLGAQPLREDWARLIDEVRSLQAAGYHTLAAPDSHERPRPLRVLTAAREPLRDPPTRHPLARASARRASPGRQRNRQRSLAHQSQARARKDTHPRSGLRALGKPSAAAVARALWRSEHPAKGARRRDDLDLRTRPIRPSASRPRRGMGPRRAGADPGAPCLRVPRLSTGSCTATSSASSAGNGRAGAAATGSTTCSYPGRGRPRAAATCTHCARRGYPITPRCSPSSSQPPSPQPHRFPRRETGKNHQYQPKAPVLTHTFQTPRHEGGQDG